MTLDSTTPPATHAPSHKSGRPSPLRLAIYAAITAATVAFAYLALRSVHFGQVWHALRYSDYVWLIPALAALPPPRWRARCAGMRSSHPAAGRRWDR